MENKNNENSIIKVPEVDFKDQLSPVVGKEEINFPRIRAMDDYLVFEKSISVPYTDAADANFYPLFYTATQQCFLLEVKLRHETNSTSGVIDVEKLVSGTARGSGVSMIASTFSIATGAGTVQRRLPTNTLANAQLAPGDSVALKATGTLTGAQYVTVTILLGVNNQNIPLSANI